MLNRASIGCLLTVGVLLFVSGLALAENIDPDGDDSQRAWAENGGWINAEPGGDGGYGIEVGDLGLTGWMWGENVGWISLSCQNTASCGTVDYGVSNDGAGELTGFAWGENVGWISFSCEMTTNCITRNYGVLIDPVTGVFSGRAWSENTGWITFASSGPNPYRVKTSWTCTDADDDGWCLYIDCDDDDPATFPGGLQICDGKNNDCHHALWPSPSGTNDGDDDLDGFSECQDDCDDGDGNTYPGAPEVNDGVDNQCAGYAGYGLVDEISGTSGFTTPGNDTEFCWEPQAGATLYQIARSTAADFSAGCTRFLTSATCLADPDVPPAPAGVFYYRVRPFQPFTGSWGTTSSGAEIMFVCGSETDCLDGYDEDGDGAIDCNDSDCQAEPTCQPDVFTFVDTAADDLATTALYDFFASLTVGPGDAMLVSVTQSDGEYALCLDQQAQVYVSDYLTYAATARSRPSAGWPKWYRSPATGDAWTGPLTGPYFNRFGLACGEFYGLCFEQVIDPLVQPEIHPGVAGSCEAVNAGTSGCGDGTWEFTIKVGPGRLPACGF